MPAPTGMVSKGIPHAIHLIRRKRVMLDADFARIYGVTTARLNQQVGRNLARFPSDFMFRLTPQEHRHLMLQTATSSGGHSGQIRTLFEAIHRLMDEPEPPPRRIGFHVRERKARYTARP